MFEAVWQQLADASAAVANIPTWQLTDAELVALLHQDQTAQAQRCAARLAWIRELDVRGHAKAMGATSTQAWLSGELLVDRAVAAADVRAARELDPVGDVPPAPGVLVPRQPAGEVPVAATGRALLAGDITRAHADVIAATIRTLHVPAGTTLAARDTFRADAEARLLTECPNLTPAQLRVCGKHIRHCIDPDGVLADERDAVTRSTFWIKPMDDTAGYRFGGTTDAVTGAQLITFIHTHAKPAPALDPRTGVMEADPRLPQTRRGHAFADLVRLAANADDSVSGGTSAQLVVTTTLQTLQSGLGELGIACAGTETGQPLSAATVRLLACDATIVPAVLGTGSEPLDIGRATRTIPAAIRRALVLRDKHCAFPGCDRPARWTQGHHIIHWSDGGPTSLANTVLLCGHHHDVLHHTPWTVAIEHGFPVFTAPATSGTGRGRPPPCAA